MTRGKIALLGFNGPLPHSIIIWQKDGINKSKTVCYSFEEQEEAICRFWNKDDYYSTYDAAVIIDQKENTTKLKKTARDSERYMAWTHTS